MATFKLTLRAWSPLEIGSGSSDATFDPPLPTTLATGASFETTATVADTGSVLVTWTAGSGQPTYTAGFSVAAGVVSPVQPTSPRGWADVYASQRNDGAFDSSIDMIAVSAGVQSPAPASEPSNDVVTVALTVTNASGATLSPLGLNIPAGASADPALPAELAAGASASTTISYPNIRAGVSATGEGGASYGAGYNRGGLELAGSILVAMTAPTGLTINQTGWNQYTAFVVFG